MKRDPKKTARNKADRLVQELIKLTDPLCLVCSVHGEKKMTECGHHFITKANSNACRYYMPNIVPLCMNCHCLVHSQPWKVEPVICFEKGEAWYHNIRRQQQVGVKANLAWYEKHAHKLQEKIDAFRRDNSKKG